MPHVYKVDKVWCTHCGETREPEYTRCPECNKMLRRHTRQKAFKTEKRRIK